MASVPLCCKCSWGLQSVKERVRKWQPVSWSRGPEGGSSLHGDSGAVSEPVGRHQTPQEVTLGWEDRLASDYGGGACGWPSRTASMARCNSSIMKGLDTYGVPEFSRKALVASLTVSPVVKMMRPANSG